MNRSVLSVVVLLACLSVVPAVAADAGHDVEMKVKVFVEPDRIEPVAGLVLEFYDVTPEYFVGAMYRAVYEDLVAKGYRIEVLVADVGEEARRYDAFFHTYPQIMDTWATLAQAHSNICVLDTIGTSAGGNLLIAMKVSDNPTVMEQEPRVCFDFTIHGNENNGTEIAHWVLLQLIAGYGSNPDITRWVDNREIWLIPFVNPDGLISRSRRNANGVDLNRNYGYSWNGGGPSVFSETELQALYHFGVNNPMTSWAQYHSGVEKAMWPWGYTAFATMDSVTHEYELLRYSQITGYPACQIARGLYPVNGGSVDWYYGATGAFGPAIEVCNGQPSPPSQIDEINAENWLAMKEQLERFMWGISGMVTDSVTDMPLEALVSVDPPDWFTYADTLGYFHKYLHAGTYAVTVSANGYETRTVAGVVVPADTFVFINVALVPDSTEPTCAFQPITNKISNSNATEAWWALRERDGRRFTLDRGAWASYDMGRSTSIINGPGNDFFVVEDDGSPDGYEVFASNEWNGPWQSLGIGAGTAGFDLLTGGLSIARYVRIVDDNSGSGVSIDAIEAVVVNAPAVVYRSKTIIDSPPGGNGDGKLDPDETADLVLELKNVGRVGVSGVVGVLRTTDTLVTVQDSAGTFGDLQPDSVRTNNADRFVIAAAAGTPREHAARMVLHLTGTDYADSIAFTVVVGELRSIDPIPDGPRLPALYWAYDDGDSAYAQAPDYEWVDISGVGTRLVLSDDQTVRVNLPTGFGPFVYYGRSFTQVSICGNGWVGPGYTTSRDYANHELPNTADPTMLALVWDDLYPPSSNGVYWYHDAANHRFIVQYDSMPTYANRNVFDWHQVVIYDTTLAAEDGNSVFTYQYLTANSYSSMTVGINDSTTGIGTQVLFNGQYHRAALPIEPGRAIKFTTDAPRTGVAEQPRSPDRAALRVAVEGNPFAGRTELRYTVPQAGRVDLAVYDNNGRRVRQLVAGEQRAGTYRLNWQGRDDAGCEVSAGVYWLRLSVGQESVTGKAIKLR